MLLALVYFITLVILLFVSKGMKQRYLFKKGQRLKLNFIWWIVIFIPIVNTLFLALMILWSIPEVINRQRNKYRVS